MRRTASALPIMVRFFQSEANDEETVIRVPESTGERRYLTIFLAVLGEMPHSEPCLTEINVGGSSATILQPFLSKRAFKSAYASLIPKLTVRSSNKTSARNTPIAFTPYCGFSSGLKSFFSYCGLGLKPLIFPRPADR
jgi:hypothetical protein